MEHIYIQYHMSLWANRQLGVPGENGVKFIVKLRQRRSGLVGIKIVNVTVWNRVVDSIWGGGGIGTYKYHINLKSISLVSRNAITLPISCLGQSHQLFRSYYHGMWNLIYDLFEFLAWCLSRRYTYWKETRGKTRLTRAGTRQWSSKYRHPGRYLYSW